jgi:peptide/nickel transport system substrate-binding protein
MKRYTILFLIFILAFTGCQLINPVPPTPTPIPATPTPLPPTEINICLGYEPESLYIYNSASQAAQEVESLIYDGLFDLVDNQYQPVILENQPNFADGSARFIPVGVYPGDPVVNTEGYLVNLEQGVQVFPTGCTSPNCAITYDGISPLQMDQITVVYKLKPGLLWSDGQALTAQDSVYSFMIASDPATPVAKHQIDQTFSYQATDDLTIEWVSQPGLVTNAFWNYFWTPLPEHAWSELSAGDLLLSDDVNHHPIGWGPFMVGEWIPGDHLQLIKNPNYFRNNEDLPKIDILNIKFFNPQDIENIGQLANGLCDVVSDTLVDKQALGMTNPEDFGFKLKTTESDRLEMLALGIKPASYDDYYYPYGVDRPDIFGDIRTRQAIAYCIDRDTIVNKLLQGSAVIADSLIPSSDPLFNSAQVAKYPFDPTAGRTLLEAAGWVDMDQNSATPLTHLGNATIPYGTPLSLNLLVSESSLQNEIAREISSNLAACGIDAKVVQIPANELFLPGPEGKIFGRQFDLALITWETHNRLDCRNFESNEIPSDTNDWLGEITGGANFYGYNNPQFDNECQKFETAGFDDAVRDEASKYLVKTLSDDLPFIPLFRIKNEWIISDNLCTPEYIMSETDLFTNFYLVNAGANCD